MGIGKNEDPPSYESTEIEMESSSGSQNTSQPMSCRHCGPGNDSDHTLADIRAGRCPRAQRSSFTFVVQEHHVNVSTTSSSNQNHVEKSSTFKPLKCVAMVVFLPTILGVIIFGLYSVATTPPSFTPAKQYADFALVSQFSKVSFMSQFCYFCVISQISICSVFSMVSVCSFASIASLISAYSLISTISVYSSLLALWRIKKWH